MSVVYERDPPLELSERFHCKFNLALVNSFKFKLWNRPCVKTALKQQEVSPSGLHLNERERQGEPKRGPIIHRLWSVLSTRQPRAQPVPIGDCIIPGASLSVCGVTARSRGASLRGSGGRDPSGGGGAEETSSCFSWLALLHHCAARVALERVGQGPSAGPVSPHFQRDWESAWCWGCAKPCCPQHPGRAWFVLRHLFILNREVCHT